MNQRDMSCCCSNLRLHAIDQIRPNGKLPAALVTRLVLRRCSPGHQAGHLNTLLVGSCTPTSNAEEASAGQVLEFLPLWPIQVVCNQQRPIHAAH